MRFWQKLLIEQRKRGKSGFTIPFIIGSQKYLPNGSYHIDIKELLTECIENDLFETCIRYCLIINELILEIRKPEIPVVYPTYKGQSQYNLSISIANTDIGDSFDKALDSLTEHFNQKLELGLFSVQPRESGRESVWEGFNQDDYNFIIECFKNL